MFPKSLNLDGMTFEYLKSPTPALREGLIRSGHAVVHPLLVSLIKHISAYGASIKSERERERIKRYDWSEVIFNPLLRPADLVISQIGEPAQYQLCKALRQSDRRIQKAAALLLALHAAENVPTVRTMTEIRDVFWSANMNDTATVMLLTFVLTTGGDAGSQKATEKHAKDNRMDLEQWTTKTMDTAVLELLGWEQEVLR